NVLDFSARNLTRQSTAVTNDVHPDLRAIDQCSQRRAAERQQQRTVDQDAWPQHVGQDVSRPPMLLHSVLGRIADQATLIAHAIHHIVATVDTGATADTFILQTIADIDSGRTNLHADIAIDAIALAYRPGVDALAARTTWIATLLIVGHDQRIGIEHHALEARIRAHVNAHLLAQYTGEKIGKGGIEQAPE